MKIMIIANNVTKKFDDFPALNSLSCKIPDGSVYGLVGANGAGKSTFLRLIMGIYQADTGEIKIDGEDVYENTKAKHRMVFVADELFFLPQSSMNRMAKLYMASYPNFSFERYEYLTGVFGLDPKKNVNTFSKGMRRQASTILALSCMADYIFFDETFDGLDPVMRNLVKKVIYDDISARQATAVITSHSLRELEDVCDQLALLHKGGILFESDIQDLKTSLFKMQVVFDYPYEKELFDGIEVLNFNKKGSVSNLIIRGDGDEVTNKISAKAPLLLEILPLSLEEVFIYEMETLGYAFDIDLGGSSDV